MRISDWSSDVCSSDLTIVGEAIDRSGMARGTLAVREGLVAPVPTLRKRPVATMKDMGMDMGMPDPTEGRPVDPTRSEEHTSELQSLMRISYAVFCLKKKTRNNHRSSTKQDDIMIERET